VVFFKRQLGNLIQRLPGGKNLLQKRHLNKIRLELQKIGDSKAVFEHYFEVNAWGDDESVSGPGSTIEYTKNIREGIPKVLSQFRIRKMLDAPCGDYNWFRMIERPDDLTYVGGDIVRALVDRNQIKFGDSSTRFISIDIVHDPLPEVDLWLCRDCFIHLSNDDIFFALDNLVNSNVSYLLTSTYPNVCQNQDIPTGLFRAINLEKPPFDFGSPEAVMDDWIDGFEVRQLALWKRESLKARLSNNRFFRRARNLR
jgi:hypothetical protein